MQAIIMAGGKGTRLRPYTYILPKPLLPIGARSILDVNIRQLVENGVDNIIIAVGYLGELIENVIGKGDKYGIDISYSHEPKPLGTVGALSLFIEQLEDSFIVMNGDTLHNVNFMNLLKTHVDHNAEATITTYNQLHRVKLGVLEINNGQVESYIEKPTHNYNVSMGIYLLNKVIVTQYVDKNKALDFPDFINKLIKNKRSVLSFNHDGFWVDLGTTEEYVNVIDNLLEIKNKYPEIPIVL